MEIYNNLKTSVWFYILLLIILIIIILLVVRGSKKKKLNTQIEMSQIKINELKSHPFAVDIAKMNAIAKINSNVLSTAEQCKKDYDLLQEKLKSSINLLQDASEDLETSNFKECQTNLDEINKTLDEASKLTEKLDEVLSGILNQASLQRKRINELKSEFHDIKSKVNDDPNSYTYSWEALDKITNSISHQFSDFEAIMETSKYDQAAAQAEQISKSIEKLNQLIQQLPELIVIARNTIPSQLSELQSNYLVAVSNGVYLKHLSIPQNIDDINNKVNESLKKIKQCDIESQGQILSDYQAKINQLSVGLQKEKDAHNQLVDLMKETASNLAVINSNIDKVKNNESTSIERYNLSQVTQVLNSVTDQYDKNMRVCASLTDSFNSKSMEASTLVISFEELNKDVTTLLKESQKMTEMISISRREELRARELISRFIVVLNESKASIRLSRLPNISNRYNEDITTAERYIDELNQLLQSETIDISKLNQLLTQAQKVIISLYKNVNALIETTASIEDFIVLTNKYRAYYPEIDNALYSAELAYRNGEYTKACKLTASALANINPELADKLNKEINEKIQLQKDA